MNCLRVWHLAKVQEDKIAFAPERQSKGRWRRSRALQRLQQFQLIALLREEMQQQPVQCQPHTWRDLMALQGEWPTQAEVHPGYTSSAASSTAGVWIYFSPCYNHCCCADKKHDIDTALFSKKHLVFHMGRWSGSCQCIKCLIAWISLII